MHAAPTPAQTLGFAQGHAGEAFALAYGPAVAGSAQLSVMRDRMEDEGWHEVAEWDRVGPHDRAFRLEPARAQISFGDGRIGRVLPAGATVACRYRAGGGAEGNVGAGTLRDAHDARVEVRQPFPAFGGAAAETLDGARGRALAFLAQRYRAITLGDFETLALSTPGVPVARARALAGHHPDVSCVPAAGCMTVVAVPNCPDDRPEAGPDFLAAVCRWLKPRTALTTELQVVGPSYLAVAVHARLHAEPGAALDAIATAAVAELDRFFHPFTGGPDGAGWPAGRAVYRSEVLAILNAVDGVAFVDRLNLVAEGNAEASCANVTLCPTQMAAAGEHRIEVIARRHVR
jgi:predicted phage baseplate assembly protein